MSLEKLKIALEGKELDFNLEDLNIMPKADFELLVNNYKTEIEDTKSKSEKSGQKVGQEILLKELKEELGFEYEQRKNPENLKKAYIEKFGAPKESNNDELEARFKLQGEQYKTDLQTSNDRYDTLQATHKTESDNKTIHEALTASFAGYDGKTNYKTKDLVTLARSNGEFTVVDGKVFQSKDGEPMKNELLQGITSDAFAKEMMLEGDYIKKTEGGRIMGDETKGGKYSMDEFIASQESQGVNTNGLQFAENMAAAQKAGTLED